MIMITVEDAEKTILYHALELETVLCPLAKAHGKILGEEICADRDLPPYDRVTMDGIAIVHSAWKQGCRRFKIEGTAQAGEPRAKLEDRKGGCIEVMTGAVLPEGCDCVVPYEELKTDGTESVVSEEASPKKNQHVHPQGTDSRKGDLLLQSGCTLLSTQIEIIASIGLSSVEVSTVPSVAVLSTGNELVDLGKEIQPYQIRLSNNYAISAALGNAGCADVSMFHTRDDQRQIERVLKGILKDFDIVIISGGVSVGRYDFVPVVLKSLGVKMIFYKVNQRPGRPLWFGRTQDRKPVFALPGNPVSSLVCTHRYILPFLRKSMGATPWPAEFVALEQDYLVEESKTHFFPVRLKSRPDGSLTATRVPYFGSGDFVSLGGSAGFIELPAEKQSFRAGTGVRFHRWRC
jgi:molybdopterin molybdotransferase